VLDEGRERGVGDFGLNLGLDVFHGGEVEILGPAIEVIERGGGLAGRGAEGEEAMQVVADFFDGEILLALLPEIGETIGEYAEGRDGAGIVAAGEDGGAARESIVDNAEFAFAGSEVGLGLRGGGVAGAELSLGLLRERRLPGEHRGCADIANDGGIGG
jgi:hypothetical protein